MKKRRGPNRFGHQRVTLTRAELGAMSPSEREARTRRLAKEKLERYRARNTEKIRVNGRANSRRRRAANPEAAKSGTRERNLRWREKNRARKTAQQRAYRERHKESNRSRDAVRRRKRYWANPEKMRAKARAEAKANPLRATLGTQTRRAALYAVPRTLTRGQWLEVVEIFDSRCAYCLERLERPTIDHIEPISKGGHHSVENVVPACRHCNSSKHDFSLPRWLWFRRACA